MREPTKSIWYQLGYAVESTRRGVREAENAGSTRNASAERTGSVDKLVAAGTGIVGDRLLSILSGHRPDAVRLAHAALAGAGAALALTLFHSRRNGTDTPGPDSGDPADAILSGAARGLLYGAVVEPRLPGSPLLRGAAFGVIEYATSPFGGLDTILGASSPHKTIPILAALFGRDHSAGGSITDHVAFGVTLGLLYGAGSERRGKREAE